MELISNSESQWFYQEVELDLNKQKATRLALAFQKGYTAAADIAKAQGFERFFAIEPTASVSYASTDLLGYTCTPEISPPVCHPETKISRRQTSNGAISYQYHPASEVAEKDVSWDTYYSLCKSFQTMQEQTGLAHGCNFNHWLVAPLSVEWFTDWFNSPLISIYYRWNTQYDTQDLSLIHI